MRLKHVKGAEEAMLTSKYIVQEPTLFKGKWREEFATTMAAPASATPTSFLDGAAPASAEPAPFLDGAATSAEPASSMSAAAPTSAEPVSLMSAATPKLYVEIGMGKGTFITQMAQRDPSNCYIGIEKFSSVLIRGLQKQEELQLPNLRLIRMDAEDIEAIFAPGEVDVIYLNFSDPWPKDRHAKRRLTSPQFLKRYEGILATAAPKSADNARNEITYNSGGAAQTLDSAAQNSGAAQILGKTTLPSGRIEFKTDNMDLFDFSLESIESSGWKMLAVTRDLHADPVLSAGNIMTEYEQRFSEKGNPIAKVIATPPRE